MSKIKFLHELPDVKELFEVIGKERNILPILVEKDYWLMHCLWGLQQQGYTFELKGGTSLSKGFNIIERFSEDIDIQIHPTKDDNVKTGKNHDKPVHIESRRQFFDKINHNLKIAGLKFERDYNFDDITQKMRSAGIRGEYDSLFPAIPDLKEGIVLELGFDQTTPYVACDICSWAFEKLHQLNISVIDNRAKQVKCYCPEYTFVEKLQTISTKYRQQQKENSMPTNFLRHYYDVYKLLESERVLKFIGSEKYIQHKQNRFRTNDEKNISKNEAFTIPNKRIRKWYSDEFKKKSAIYFGQQVRFEEILSRIFIYTEKL